MNYKSIWLAMFFAFLLSNCRGPEGPPGPVGLEGPQGEDGPAGPQTVALMYETNFTLNTANNWESFYAFPQEDADDIYPEDVVLVYVLENQIKEDNGELTDIWRLMPINDFTPDGILAINYDFSVADVRIFAEATFPLTDEKNNLKDLLARIVIVPADYSPNGRKAHTINYENYEEVKTAFSLPETSTKNRIPLKKILEQYQR